jgi:type III restriction enzyme
MHFTKRSALRGQRTTLSRVDLERALAEHPDLLVLNDEAHHVHSDDLEWAKAIARLHEAGRTRGSEGLVMQLDFSATPYTGAGDRKVFFPHIIYDYPLAAAIRDQVVKRPKIGEIEHAPEPLTRDYVKRNRLQIDTGVEVFRQFQRDFKPAGKKPVLFVMADQTRNADKVGAYLEREHRLKTWSSTPTPPGSSPRRTWRGHGRRRAPLTPTSTRPSSA